ncbi:hypothetical protein BOTBODRAFT_474815 [Botryobasidium botryosum FD-172 SS1]|uniref:Uncharacterized protein n=1 Tax=Botryobasidium botryosum (strain FD-172 SS1) TaxID=930990 RepID=A0A067N3R3_BOTB1|nr:hypothetical protein BOTBODRAFT_474815 [Botryobasidium botryosum FD-172 SS1]
MEEDRYDYPGGYSNQSHSGYGQQSPMASYYDPRRYSDATPGMAGIGARRSYAPYPDQYEQRVRQSYTQSGPEPYGAPDGGYGPPARASGHYHSQDPYASQPPRATQYLDSPYSHAYQPAVPENTSRSQLSYGSHITPSSQPTNSEEAYRSDRALSPEATGAIRSRMSGPTVGGEGRRESDAGLDGAYELRRREILKVCLPALCCQFKTDSPKRLGCQPVNLYAISGHFYILSYPLWSGYSSLLFFIPQDLL